MNDQERDDRNRLIDILFEQINNLEDEDKKIAHEAILEWQTAKTSSFLGLGPMTSKQGYLRAYLTFKKLGLETGGMLNPCNCE